MNFFELGLSFSNAFLSDDILVKRHFTLQHLYNWNEFEESCTEFDTDRDGS